MTAAQIVRVIDYDPERTEMTWVAPALHCWLAPGVPEAPKRRPISAPSRSGAPEGEPKRSVWLSTGVTRPQYAQKPLQPADPTQ